MRGRSPARRRSSTGSIPVAIIVAAAGNGLTLSAPGEPTLELQAFEERRWRAVSSLDIVVSFADRGGIVERMTIERGASQLGYAREGFADATSTAVLPDAPAPTTPGTGAGSASAADPVPRAPARPWPASRGANAAGAADGQGAVTGWDVTTGRNIRWKTPIPGLATSSPIVWGTRVFVASAASADDTSFRTGLYGDVAPVENLSPHSWRLHALDLHTGAELWSREVFAGAPRTKRHTKSSQANATPVTDGLQNPDDPRQIVFTVLPGHGVVIVEKWVEGKQPFQVIWEAMDNRDIEIANDIPQGPFMFQNSGQRSTISF